MTAQCSTQLHLTIGPGGWAWTSNPQGPSQGQGRLVSETELDSGQGGMGNLLGNVSSPCRVTWFLMKAGPPCSCPQETGKGQSLRIHRRTNLQVEIEDGPSTARRVKGTGSAFMGSTGGAWSCTHFFPFISGPGAGVGGFFRSSVQQVGN